MKTQQQYCRCGKPLRLYHWHLKKHTGHLTHIVVAHIAAWAATQYDLNRWAGAGWKDSPRLAHDIRARDGELLALGSCTPEE